MLLGLNAEQALLRDNIRRYVQEHIAPVITRHERDQTFPFELLEGLSQFGYLGGMLPESEGGMDLDYMTWAMMMEEMGRAWMSLRTILNITNGAINRLAALGTAEQKQRFLHPLLANRRRTFMAITEPDTGSNVAGIQTRADYADGHYVLNGRKLWITNGIHADFGVVVARTFSPDCNGGLSLFLVEQAVTPFEARKVETMVLRCSGTAELSFHDARIPRENLLGQEGQAFGKVMSGLDGARLNIAMGAVGAAQAALDLAVDYARTRKQFGRPIGAFQLIQKHIVDMTVRVEAARALGYRAAAALQAGGPARMECSIAKLYATEVAHEVASMALQVHGGLGYATEYPIERIFRDTRGGMIPEGTTEIQTLIVGREILGMSAIA